MLLCAPFLAASCVGEKNVPTVFPFSTNYPVGTETVLYALSKHAAQGIIPFAKPEKLEYAFQEPLRVPGDYSLELEYGFQRIETTDDPVSNKPAALYQIVLEIEGDAAWELPLDAAFLGIADTQGRMGYAVPLIAPSIGKFSITAVPIPTEMQDNPESLVFKLDSLRLVNRWYGFTRGKADPQQSPPRYFMTPFVYQGHPGKDTAIVVNPPAPYRSTGKVEVLVRGLERGAQATVGTVRFAYTGSSPATQELFIPSGALPHEPYPLTVTPARGIHAVQLIPAAYRAFPADPIPADPGIILDYPQESWRARSYEVFRWENFPQILIFDTRTYDIQDRFFKRLAFFTEKQGFRGRLATDREIADLHGWNAHDYRAESLAAFFEAAAETNFPLRAEERELENMLLKTGVIVRNQDTRIIPGAGGIISISRESPPYLRSLFMVHEGFHGIFFIDPDFREFSSRRWENLPSTGKRFIRSFFDYQKYDIQDEYLMINEFMAHCLQQSTSQAARYFGETLAARIDASSWRRTVLPPKDEASGSWPEIARIFRIEAEAFSSYVNQRWGLAAGRVHQVTVP
jgi:hypothetical protein